MNLIETRMVYAVQHGEPFSGGNTTVTPRHDEEGEYLSCVVSLHGHQIAHYWFDHTDKRWVIVLDDAGWRTRTTKSRLNALLFGVVQGDDDLTLFQKGKAKTSKPQPAWFYQIGPNTYRWTGDQKFLCYTE